MVLVVSLVRFFLGENACFDCRPKWASVSVVITINIWFNVEL